jgi:hypothetical protein
MIFLAKYWSAMWLKGSVLFERYLIAVYLGSNLQPPGHVQDVHDLASSQQEEQLKWSGLESRVAQKVNKRNGLVSLHLQ